MSNALSRLEHLRSLPAPQPQPKSNQGGSNMDDLIDKLEHLPLPSKAPIDLGEGKPLHKGASKTLPRGVPCGLY